MNRNLNFSRIALGCEPLGGDDWGEFNEKQSLETISAALDYGINIFDTADVYGLGRSERILSKALGKRRHDVVIITKFGVNWHTPKAGSRARTFFDSSPKRVIEALENSLRRLQLDCIPIYLIHWPDPKTPIEETLTALIRCKEMGKIQAIGVSNFSASQIHQAHEFTDIAVVQVEYSLINREAASEIFSLCNELGISVVVYGALAQGFLTGKYNQNAKFPDNDRRHRLPAFQPKNAAKNLKLVERLRLVGEKHGKTPAQVAIRWVLQNPAISCAIVGAKTPKQVAWNVASVEWEIPQGDYLYLSQQE